MGHTSPACHVMPSCIVSSVALIRDAGRFTMVAIAQSVEHLIVVQEVARSSRVSHPIFSLFYPNGLGVLHLWFEQKKLKCVASCSSHTPPGQIIMRVI